MANRNIVTALVLAAMLCLASAAGAQTRIVAFGDGNTYGQGLAREEAYPAKLEALLKSKGYNVTVVNAGVAGDTTADALKRVDAAVPQGTAIAIVEFGVTDAQRPPVHENGRDGPAPDVQP